MKEFTGLLLIAVTDVVLFVATFFSHQGDSVMIWQIVDYHLPNFRKSTKSQLSLALDSCHFPQAAKFVF